MHTIIREIRSRNQLTVPKEAAAIGLAAGTPAKVTIDEQHRRMVIEPLVDATETESLLPPEAYQAIDDFHRDLDEGLEVGDVFHTVDAMESSFRADRTAS